MTTTRLPRRLASALLAMTLWTAPAVAANDGGFLGGFLKTVGNTGNAETSATPAAKGLAEKDKAQASGPLAWVDDISDAPAAGVDVADLLEAGQSIDLGRKGTLRLGYFDDCRVETIRGGRVVVKAGGSAVSGGKVTTESVTCSASATLVPASASEAATAAKRATPFSEKSWYEAAMKTRTPLLRWDATGKATITVTAMDASTPEVIWTKTTSKDRITYSGPKLEVGMPYLAEVTVGGRTYSGLFSYDPKLDANDALHRVVVLHD